MKQSFTAQSTFDGILMLIHEAVKFLTERGASPRALFIGELVLEEVLTNIVKYAYDNEPDPARTIKVMAEVSKGNVSLEIRDDGQPFDPLKAPPPKFGEPIKTQRMGGRGIYVVKTVVKESRYRREEGWNILTLGFPVRPGQ